LADFRIRFVGVPKLGVVSKPMILLFFAIFILLIGFVLFLFFVGGVITLFREKPKPIETADAPTVINTFVNR
jgi:hypothetical protein